MSRVAVQVHGRGDLRPSRSAASKRGLTGKVLAARSHRPLRRRRARHIAQVAVLPAFADARETRSSLRVVSDDRTKKREIAGATTSKTPTATAIRRLPERRGRRRLHRAAELDAPRIHGARRPSRRARVVREADGPDVAGLRADDRCVPTRRVKLMIAYRLHFETLNISAMESGTPRSAGGS